ncbi:DUF3880 domain-containing protein, partial [bacterium]|nr:DUF3880 domain-containing protein [bacterium]
MSEPFWPANYQIVDSVYPGISQAIRDVEGAASFDADATFAHAQQEIETHWADDVDLFIVFRFSIGPLAKQLFDQVNLREAGDLRGRRILLMDDCPQRFRWGMEHDDWAVLLESERCLFHLCDPEFHQLNRLIGMYRHLTQVKYALLCADPSAPEKSLSIIRERFEITREDTRKRIEDTVSKMRLVEPTPFPKTVRFFVPGHNMLQDACVQSMRAMGYGAQRLQWQKPLYRFIRSYAWLNPAREERIDTALFLNATPQTFNQNDLFQRLPIKAVSWFVDNPRRYVNSPNDFNGCDAVGVFDSAYISYLKKMTDAPIVEARTGYSVDPALAKPDEDFQAIEVAFVGELGSRGFAPYEKTFAATQPERLKHMNDLLAQLDASQ